MPNFNNGTVTSVTLDEYDTLSVSGTARLQVTVGSKPQFETTSVGDLTFGPFGFITYITINATGLGSYSQQPSNNPIPVAMVDVSPAQLAAPTSTQLAITNVLYQRNAPPYDIYQSNGTAFVPLGGVGSVQAGALAASTTVAPNATAVQNAIAASAGTGVVRVAATNAIPLDTAGNGKSMPLIAGQSIAISSPTTLTIAGGAVEGGTCEVYLAVTSTLTLPTTYAGMPANRGVVVNGSVSSGFNYRLLLSISAGDLVIFCFQQSAITPAPVFLTQTPPPGTVGTAYSYTYAALNTTSFAVFSGTLPAGLSLNTSTGALAGTPTTAATSAFVISATGVGGTTNSTAQRVVVTVTLALDAITTASIGAYSLNRKLRSAYAGSACVIRSSAGGNITVGFSGNTVDWPTAMTALGANNAFLVTVFDQSGNARDATQATVAQQPQIASAGVVNKQASLYPASIGNTGANTGLVTAGFTLGATLGGATIYGAGGLLSNAGAYGFASLLAGADANDYDTSNSLFVANNGLNLQSNAGPGGGQLAAVVSGATIVSCSRFLSGAVAELWVNGVAGTGSGSNTGLVGTAGAGNKLAFHSRIIGTQAFQPTGGNISEVVYFPRLGDPERLTFENNLRTAYGV